MYFLTYKLYLASEEQGELRSFDLDVPVEMDEQLRQVLKPVKEVPLPTHNLLSAVGRTEGSSVWHSVPYQHARNNGISDVLYLYAGNAREILLTMADPNTPGVRRNQFHALNPIPGAHWVQHPVDGWLLDNVDRIWPEEYEVADLRADVFAYKNLLRATSNVLPASFLSTFLWSGKGSKSGLASMDPVQMSINSEFYDAPAPPRAVLRRNEFGAIVNVHIPGEEPPRFVNSTCVEYGVVDDVWTPELETSAMELMLGAAALVGEAHAQPTRARMMGKKLSRTSPSVTLSRLVDGPRTGT